MLQKLTLVASHENDTLTLRRGQALALVMVLFMIVTGVQGSVNIIALNLQASVNSAIAFTLFLLVYVINRRGQVQRAISIFLSGGVLLIIYAAVVVERPVPAVFFLSVIVVIAAGFGRPRDPLIWAMGLTGAPFVINLILYHSLAAPAEQFRLPDGTSIASIFFLEIVAIGHLWMLAGSAYLTSQLLHEAINKSEATAARAVEVHQSLRRSEERFAKVFERNPVGITITRLDDGRIIDVNDSLLTIMGYSRDEIIGKTTFELNTWEKTSHREQAVQMLIERQPVHNQQIRFRTKSGELRDGLNSIELIELEGEQCLLSMLHDITERQRAEAALHESEEQYRLIAEHSRDMIVLLDSETRVLYASPSHQPVLGYAPIKMIGQAPVDNIHPDDRDLMAREWAKLAHQDHIQTTVRAKHANGEWLWLETSSSILDEQGSTLNVSRDITERKRLEAQLLQSQKMETVGRLAGGVAHDFNNLLTAIIGYADLALEDLPADSPMHEDMQELRKAADRATNLTRQLLAFARKQVIEPRVMDLNQLITNMHGFMHHLIGEHIELVTLLASDLGSIRVDTNQIEQVVVNLMINARDAMPQGGRLTITTANVVLDAEYGVKHFDVVAGRYILLTIGDTGMGMDAAVQEHLFEPFFTTKGPGKGTGLGLATCYGIIKQHGGYILPYSELDNGTLMKIYLPRVDAPLDLLPIIEAQPNPRGDETILLVEDEPMVRELAMRVLRSQGYTVLEAGDGIEVLQFVAQQPDMHIDLLITDVIMPRMGGAVLAEQLSTMRPGIKVLFTSGYTEDAILHIGQLVSYTHFLHKPFSPVELAQKVRSILDS